MFQILKTVLIILLLGGLAIGQAPTASKNADPEKAAPVTGKQMFSAYCAVCHGADAKGGGPFSPQLKVWPPDLTILAKKNNGVYPALHVSEIIDGEFGKPAHGSPDMPIWGPVFRSLAHGRKDSAQRRIDSLVKYLEELQQK